MTTHRRTEYTGQEANDRHRLYGSDLYAVDVDLVEVSLDLEPVALIEYKHFKAQPISDFQRTAIQRLARDIPAFTARYWPPNWTYLITPLNAAGDELIDPAGELLTEREFADLLHSLRDFRTTETEDYIHDEIDERAEAYVRRQSGDRPPIPKQDHRASQDALTDTESRTSRRSGRRSTGSR